MSIKVGIIMGSRSDWDTMVHAVETLESLEVPHEVRVVSAHRTPDRLRDFVLSAEEQGIGVFIAAAGMAAHLAGVVASQTTLPVIGIPVAILLAIGAVELHAQRHRAVRQATAGNGAGPKSLVPVRNCAHGEQCTRLAPEFLDEMDKLLGPAAFAPT